MSANDIWLYCLRTAKKTSPAGQADFSSSDHVNTTHAFFMKAKFFSSLVYQFCYELFWYAYLRAEVKKTGQFTLAISDVSSL